MVDKDYHAILGVSEDASKAEIKEAYKNIVKNRPLDCPKAERQAVSEAFDVLYLGKSPEEVQESRRPKVRKYSHQTIIRGGPRGELSGRVSERFEQEGVVRERSASFGDYEDDCPAVSGSEKTATSDEVSYAGDYYDVLGIEKTATSKDIREAYINKRREYAFRGASDDEKKVLKDAFDALFHDKHLDEGGEIEHVRQRIEVRQVVVEEERFVERREPPQKNNSPSIDDMFSEDKRAKPVRRFDPDKSN